MIVSEYGSSHVIAFSLYSSASSVTLFEAEIQSLKANKKIGRALMY